MLRVAVCIKQIPLVGETELDPETKRIRRSGPCVISAFDLRAIALAVSLKERLPAVTTVVTMGPPQAEEALRDALAMGIDRAVQLQDAGFAGADTLATARALAAWLGGEGFNLILAGKHSLDSDTGQVGPEIAELLRLPHISAVQRLDVVDGTLRAERETDDGYDEVECALPAVLTCAERLIKPIKFSPEQRRDAGAAPIDVISVASLGDQAGRFGIAGSPTSVGEIRVLQRKARECRRTATEDAAATAAEVVALIDAWRDQDTRESAHPVSASLRTASPGRDILVICEFDGLGAVTSASLELLSSADRLAGESGGAVVAFVPGRRFEPAVALLASYGADRVVILDVSEDVSAAPDSFAAAAASIVEQLAPWALLVPATLRGRDWAPRLAARLGLGLTGDAIGLRMGPESELVALKPAFGGNVVAEIRSRTLPQMVTVRPGMLGLAAPTRSRKAVVSIASPRAPQSRLRIVRSHRTVDAETASLEHGRTIIGIGMGIGGVDALPAIRHLAQRLGASLCATRRVADAGWLPRQVQVGLTGKGLNAHLYIGLGVSGSFNHMVGLERVERIIAINSDPKAPIFECADLGVLGDCAELVPALVNAVGRVPDGSLAKSV